MLLGDRKEVRFLAVIVQSDKESLSMLGVRNSVSSRNVWTHGGNFATNLEHDSTVGGGI